MCIRWTILALGLIAGILVGNFCNIYQDLPYSLQYIFEGLGVLKQQTYFFDLQSASFYKNQVSLIMSCQSQNCYLCILSIPNQLFNYPFIIFQISIIFVIGSYVQYQEINQIIEQLSKKQEQFSQKYIIFVHNNNFFINMTQIFGTPKLPSQFAQKMLACQIQIELSEPVPKQIVLEMLQLCSKGKEYFESIKNYRYKYFQKKLTSIMLNPKTLYSLSHSEPLKQETQKQKQFAIKHKCEKLFNDLTAETSVLTSDKIKRIVAENDIKCMQIKESIQDEISEQEKRLQLKLERRKFQKMNRKTLSACDFTSCKSTTDSLFNENEECKPRVKIQADFSAVINEHEDEQGQIQDSKTGQT